MNLLRRQVERRGAQGRRHVEQTARSGLRFRHFRFSTLSALTVVSILAIGVVGQLFLPSGIAPNGIEAADLAAVAGVVVVAAVLVAVVPVWPVVLFAALAVWAVPLEAGVAAYPVLLAAASFSLLLGPAVQVVRHWDRAIVLRVGRFHRVLGPGPHILLPVLDALAGDLDMRIRVTDFRAEKSITRDTVPVHVDALAFWMIWDAGKAILEVEEYVEAVTLSAQTALRDAIGRNDLARLLSEREELGTEIQKSLDAKTSPWGITILSVEFLEVLVPQQLEDALSKKAQAERERQSRIILSSAEVEIAEKFEEAAMRYRHNPTAFQLRTANMVYDGMKQNKNMILVPSSAVESMSLGTSLGAAALRRLQEGSGEDRSTAGAAGHQDPGGETHSDEHAGQ